jgi:hypothetical protein
MQIVLLICPPVKKGPLFGAQKLHVPVKTTAKETPHKFVSPRLAQSVGGSLLS